MCFGEKHVIGFHVILRSSSVAVQLTGAPCYVGRWDRDQTSWEVDPPYHPLKRNGTIGGVLHIAQPFFVQFKYVPPQGEIVQLGACALVGIFACVMCSL